MSSRKSRLVGIAAALTVTFAASSALADQFVAMDETWVHTPDLPDSHYHTSPSAQTPANWTSPVDYSQGTAWVYLEVQTKPTAQPTKFQVCFEATPTYACTDQSPTYTTIGTYEWSTPFANFWSPPGTSVDWSLGVNKLACILKDTMNNKPSQDNVGPTVAALYTPTQVRMVVTIVSPGGTYVPPTPTGTGGAGGGGGAGATSASASVTSGATSGTGAGGASGGTSGATGSGGAGGAGAASSSGCAVGGATRTDDEALGLALSVGALVALARRRPRRGDAQRR